MTGSLMVALLLFILAGPRIATAQIYVDAAATGTEDGSSWTDAYTDLQDALAVATGSDEIWIAEGTYTPGTNRSDSFTITGNQDGLKIYGGFAGGETSRSERDPTANPVVLSGDLGNNDGSDFDDDGVPDSGREENAHHVIFFNGGEGIGPSVGANVTTATVLGSVTVTGGDTEGSFSGNGGGIYCDGQGGGNECSPTISNVTFTGNSAQFEGGAIYSNGTDYGISSLRITNTIFRGNTAAEGGAIYNDSGFGGTSNPQIAGSIFIGNSARDFGGAIYNRGNSSGTSSPYIVNSNFIENSVSAFGGGDIASFGLNGTSRPTITNTILWNVDDDDNAIYNSDATLTLSHTLLEGGFSSIRGSTTNGGNNFTTDPLFADVSDPAGPDGVLATEDDGLRLTPGSPALDAGSNAPFASGGVAENVDTDLSGADRIQDNDGDGTAVVSLGAYEAAKRAARLRLQVAGRPDTETAVLTLTNLGSEGVTGAEVSLGLPSELSAIGSTGDGSVTGGTWTVDVPAQTTVRVTVDLERSDSADSGLLSGTAQLDTDSYTVEGGFPDVTQSGDAEANWGLPEAPYGPGTALAFDGTNDYLRADAVSDAVAATDAYTVSAWIRPASATGTAGVLSFNTSTGGNRSILFYRDQTFAYYDDAIGYQESGSITPGAWHHVTVTIDAVNNGTLYVNGTETATFTTDVHPVKGDRFSIGQEWDNDAESDFFEGAVDEVRIWSTARSQADIRATMHQTLPGDTPGLIASYRFDAAQADQRFDDSFTGTTAYDLTGRRNATHVGEPQWIASSTRLGQESVVISTGETGALGPIDAQLAVTSTDAHATLYRYGDPNAEIFEDPSVPLGTERSTAVWGVVPSGTADLQLTYGNVTVPNPSAVYLAERPRPTQSWTDRSKTPSSETFTLSGQTDPQEFTLYGEVVQTFYVDADASGADTGTSWTDAFTDLQDALDAAAGGDEIWIAEGTYLPGPTLNDSFTMSGTQDGLKVYGGFAGDETALSDRDPRANETILSGDIDGDGTPAGNSYHVLVLDGSTSPITLDTVLDGFVIAGGAATGSGSDSRGGGIFCDGSGASGACSPTVTQVVIQDNQAGDRGGGWYSEGGGGTPNTPAFNQVVFRENNAGTLGGGMYRSASGFTGSSTTFNEVAFIQNSAASGGAMYNEQGSNPVAMSRTAFLQNRATSPSSTAGHGGALFNESSSPIIANSVFWQNAADRNGGAIYNDARSGQDSSPELANVVLTKNSAGSNGGAIYNRAENAASSSPAILNATFFDNEAASNGGAIANAIPEGSSGGAQPEIANTIFFQNQAPDAGDAISNQGSGAIPGVRHSLFTDGVDADVSGPLAVDDNNGAGDPLFVNPRAVSTTNPVIDPSNDGLRPAANSPVVDAGDNSLVPSELAVDAIGDERIQDGNEDGTATVNIGAYETPGVSIATSVTITGTDGIGTDAGWRIVSAPYTGAVAGDLRLTHGSETNVPRLQRNIAAVWDDSDPDGSTGGTGAYVVADPATPLESGHAVLLYLDDDLRDPVEPEGLTISLSETTSATRQGIIGVQRDDLAQSAQWHLIGNPYPTDYELSSLTTSGSPLVGNGFKADAQVYDANVGSWKLIDTGSATLAAWQGAFIERSNPGSGPTTVTFDPSGRTAPNAPFIGSQVQGPTAASDAERGTLWLEGGVTGASGDPVATDQAIGVRFHESATNGWDAWDTSKLAPLEAPSVALSAQGPGESGGDVAKAVESRPWPEDAADPDADLTAVSVAVQGDALPSDGTLTLQVREWDLPDTWAAELIDTQGTSDTSDDQTVPLEPGMDYPVDISSLTDAPETERFVVQIAPNTGALPVELAGFGAQRSGDEAITVQWQTLSETNNAGFEVQRAAGSTWASIARLNGAGNTDEPQSYRVEDTDLPYEADSLSYRLRQIDTDGTESFSEAITIARPVMQAELLPTYPNPVRGQATVRFAVPERQDVRITLYDMLGRRIRTVVDTNAEGRTEAQFDVSDLASGTYFLRMQTAGHIETQRITVVR
jgi:predicted outer membrane repeat protein